MRASWFLGLLVLVAACTERNKAFCGDGFCTDPSRPYCDRDGAIGGTPGECIAVQCTPLTFEMCRGDLAVRCNASGDNFDEVSCPLGCDPDAAGCIECTSSAQCPVDRPTCDRDTSQCRACIVDADCESSVCDLETGECVAEDDIVYAAPTEFGTCSRSQPCPLPQALTLATNTAPTPIVRLLPGTYTVPLEIANPTAAPLEVVASDATIAVIGDDAAVDVRGGAHVVIRGLSTTSQRQIRCGDTATTSSTLELRDAVLTAVGTATQIEINRCSVQLTDSRLSLGSSDPVAVTANATFTAARVDFGQSATPRFVLLADAAGAKVEITDSLLQNVSFLEVRTGPLAVGPRVVLAHDTLVLTSRPFELCQGATVANRTVLIENSIFASQGGFDTIQAPNPANCTFVNSMLSRQQVPPAGTFVANPMFVDEAGRDFHLLPGSPAIDAAIDASVDSSKDLDGVARPQGPRPDIGAYER